MLLALLEHIHVYIMDTTDCGRDGAKGEQKGCQERNYEKLN
jgi:hypothetical protein